MMRIWRLVVVVGCVVGMGAVVAPGNARPAHFTMATHREPPHIPPGDYQPERLRVISIVPTGGSKAANSVTSRLLWFGNAVTTGKWYAAMNKAYGLGGPTGLSRGYRANVASLGHHPSNAAIAKFVNSTAHSLKIKRAPHLKTIWLVYFHCGTSSDTASKATCGSADHESPQLPSGVTNHVFGPLDSLAPVLVNDTQWNDTAGHHSLVTRNASHEIIEGATDHGGSGYGLVVPDKAHPWLGGGSPWSEVQNGGSTEVGDQGRIYGQLISLKYTNAAAPAHNYTYDYARIFTNQAAAHGGDFSRPASPVPYYDTTVAKDWYRLPATNGHFVKVTIKGWSVRKEKDWTLTATLQAWDGAPTATSPCSTTKTRLLGPHGKRYPLSAGPVMNNNTRAYLDVAYDSSAPGHWCMYELRSHRTGKEPGGTGHPDAGGDLYHSWMVGFYIP